MRENLKFTLIVGASLAVLLYLILWTPGCRYPKKEYPSDWKQGHWNGVSDKEIREVQQ